MFMSGHQVDEITRQSRQFGIPRGVGALIEHFRRQRQSCSLAEATRLPN